MRSSTTDQHPAPSINTNEIIEQAEAAGVVELVPEIQAAAAQHAAPNAARVPPGQQPEAALLRAADAAAVSQAAPDLPPFMLDTYYNLMIVGESGLGKTT